MPEASGEHIPQALHAFRDFDLRLARVLVDETQAPEKVLLELLEDAASNNATV